MGRDAKKRKVSEFPEGYTPTLKDLRDRAKFHKIDDDTALQKAAPLMQWSYETQLNMKNTFVKTAVRSFKKLAIKRSEELGREPPAWCGKDWKLAAQAPFGCCCPLDSPIGAPPASLEGWRNKCEFTIGYNAEGKVEIGFVLKIKDDGTVIVGSVEKVPLVPLAMQRVCGAIRSCIESSPFAVYDRRTGFKTGVWRMLLCRISPSGEILVMVQTTTLSGETRAQFEQLLQNALWEKDLGVISVYMQFNDEVTDAARPNAPLALLCGKPRLEMPLLGLKLQIGPLSFFNPNTTTCKFLMETTLEYLNLKKTDILLDIFSGVGTIGICAAGLCRKVIGVEIVAEAVENAEANASLNGIENTSFHTGKAEILVPKIVGDLDPSDEVCAVVDPARAGLHPQLVNVLRNRTQIKRIVYVSCNAESCAEDVAKLSVSTDGESDDFVPLRVVAVDSFPQTLHVEVILALERSWKPLDGESAE